MTLKVMAAVAYTLSAWSAYVGKLMWYSTYTRDITMTSGASVTTAFGFYYDSNVAGCRKIIGMKTQYTNTDTGLSYWDGIIGATDAYYYEYPVSGAISSIDVYHNAYPQLSGFEVTTDLGTYSIGDISGCTLADTIAIPAPGVVISTAMAYDKAAD